MVANGRSDPYGVGECSLNVIEIKCLMSCCRRKITILFIDIKNVVARMLYYNY